jgi:hypothetical protein
MVLAGEIIEFFNKTIVSKGKQKIGVQFGAYATFASFFGLSELGNVNPGFRNVVDYASSMVFELFTNTSAQSGGFPSTDEMCVRFIYSNGTASSTSEPREYPLFGTDQGVITWNDFDSGMKKFAVRSTEQWCNVCSNTDESCAAFAHETSGNDAAGCSSLKGQSGNGISPTVNGVIGAMVTLAVVLGVAAVVLVVGGCRVVSKKRLAAISLDSHVSEMAGKA